jgi:hypothetical protein
MLAGCDGNGPTSSSGSKGAVLHGVALGGGAAAEARGGVSALSTKTKIKVTVREDPSITTVVSVNGTFTLENLPDGTITLEFSVDGVVVGTVTVTGISSGVEVKLVVEITDVTVILIELEIEDEDDDDEEASKSCMINGGKVGKKIELEGNVASGAGATFEMTVNGNRASGPVDVDASGADVKCNGPSSSDKKDKDDCDLEDISAGDKIHVRGTLLTCTLSDAQVVASEVKIQKNDD